MKKADIIAGILGILLSFYIFMESAKFPEDNVLLMGPSFFPRILAVLMLIMSIALIVIALMGKSAKTAEKLDIRDPGIQRSIIALVATVIYLLLFKRLGFILDSILYLMFLMYLLKLRNYVQMVLVSIGVSVAVYFIFKVGLSITLPLGILG
ncbi:MAG: tripartite tricarboxylate transporter TctB family protein [Clostridia bacterium]|nr:tripartite tricarboxylate transporter TctB family protein [Clostridia bacterium]